jgi:uncharacterized membrane protein YkvA (DUF1232 family)
MRAKERAAGLLRDIKLRTWALSYACRDPETPWYAKAWAALVVAYAVSPIDLIPDFIPILGALDDIILVPLGIALAVRMIPRPVMERAMERAREREAIPGRSRWIAAALIILVWAFVLAVAGFAILRHILRSQSWKS